MTERDDVLLADDDGLDEDLAEYQAELDQLEATAAARAGTEGDDTTDPVATADDETTLAKQLEVRRLNALSDAAFDEALAAGDALRDAGYPEPEESQAAVEEWASKLSEQDFADFVDPPDSDELARRVDAAAADRVEQARQAAIEAQQARMEVLIEQRMRATLKGPDGEDAEPPSETEQLAELHRSTALGRLSDADFDRLMVAREAGLTGVPSSASDAELNQVYGQLLGSES